MIGADSAIQKAIYDALTASPELMALVTGVYDRVPQLDERQLDPSAAFPFVVVGDDDLLDWDTDTEVGQTAECEVSVWSRYSGRTQAKAIQDEIYNVLNRATLNVQGFHFVDCLYTQSRSDLQPDGKTVQGVSLFTVTVQR